MPNWSAGRKKMDGSKAREMAQAADVDALVDGNGDASWQVDDSDYPPVPMSMEDFIRDSGDILLNLDADQFLKLRKRLLDVLWWKRLMLAGSTNSQHMNFSGSMSNMAHEILALLLASLEKNGITEEMLKEKI